MQLSFGFARHWMTSSFSSLTRDGFTGGCGWGVLFFMARGGAIFHDKAKNY